MSDLDIGNWQKNAEGNTKKIHLGSPSSYWSEGLQKRLDLVAGLVDLNNKKILDIGCGLGMFVEKFRNYSDQVYGLEVDEDKYKIASSKFPNIRLGKAENLPFEDDMFDIVFLHEVIEHVEDEKMAIKEAFRVLKPNGRIVIFCPNRAFPVETHGVYLFGKYRFGNIPLVTYLPSFLFKKLTPHVANYWKRDLVALVRSQQFEVEIHKYILPGFDRLGRRVKFLKRLSQTSLTTIPILGISHMVVGRKE